MELKNLFSVLVALLEAYRASFAELGVDQRGVDEFLLRIIHYSAAMTVEGANYGMEAPAVSTFTMSQQVGAHPFGTFDTGGLKFNLNINERFLLVAMRACVDNKTVGQFWNKLTIRVLLRQIFKGFVERKALFDMGAKRKRVRIFKDIDLYYGPSSSVMEFRFDRDAIVKLLQDGYLKHISESCPVCGVIPKCDESKHTDESPS